MVVPGDCCALSARCFFDGGSFKSILLRLMAIWAATVAGAVGVTIEEETGPAAAAGCCCCGGRDGCCCVAGMET